MRRMENTLAASVDPSTEPIKSPSSREVFRIKWQKRPVKSAVSMTPALESSTAFFATGLAASQLVQNPP